MVLKHISTAYNRKNLRRDVLNLLRRRRRVERQLVAVQTSTIKNAGKGVFCQQETIKAGTALCLYPGVYTPPLPCTDGALAGSLGEDMYLAGSASELDGRAYILNLSDVGGHIDGEEDHTCIPGSRENPSAIGQFINHPSRANGQEPNVGVVSFKWPDIMPFDHAVSSEATCTDNDDGTMGTLHEVGQCSDEYASDLFYDIPNVPRADGSPWFFDGTASEIVYFAESTNDEDTASISTGGALIYAITDLHKGDECCLDYSLQKPYPAWARDWYEPVALAH